MDFKSVLIDFQERYNLPVDDILIGNTLKSIKKLMNRFRKLD